MLASPGAYQGHKSLLVRPIANDKEFLSVHVVTEL
jgi:hypothetical protein